MSSTNSSDEAKKEYYRQWREQNRDKIRANSKRYKATAKGKETEKRWEHSPKGKEARARQVKKYQQTAQGRAVKQEIDTRRRRVINKVALTTEELRAIQRFYKDRPEGYHVDHIIPLARGGTHTLDNLQHLESSLNHRKNASHPDEWDDPRPMRCKA